MTYTVGQLAKEMGVTPRTIILWERKGKIPTAKRINGRRVFTKEQVELIKKELIKTIS